MSNSYSTENDLLNSPMEESVHHLSVPAPPPVLAPPPPVRSPPPPRKSRKRKRKGQQPQAKTITVS